MEAQTNYHTWHWGVEVLLRWVCWNVSTNLEWQRKKPWTWCAELFLAECGTIWDLVGVLIWSLWRKIRLNPIIHEDDTLIGSLLKFYGLITRRILLPRNSNRISSTLEPQRFSRRWWCASLLLMGKPLKLFLSMLPPMPWNWIRSINFISPSLNESPVMRLSLYLPAYWTYVQQPNQFCFVLRGASDI